MSASRFLAASFVVFLIGAGSGLVLHGLLLEDAYLEQQHLLRRWQDLSPRLPYMALGYALQGPLFCYLFVRGRERRGLAAGIGHGLLLGLLVFVPGNLVHYALQPFPGRLVGLWVAAGLVQMAACGAAVAAIGRGGPAR